MNVTTNILNIIKNNKKLETIMEIERKLIEVKNEITLAKNTSDVMYIKKLLDMEMQLKIDERPFKESLDNEEKTLYNNLMVYLEYNNYTDEIRRMEKASKKSNNLESTVNSEGRKKEIDKNLVDYYKLCVAKKNEISKEYMKSFNALETYKINECTHSEKMVEKDLEEKQEINNVIMLEQPKKEEKEESNKIEKLYKRKFRKFITGIALGVAACVSLISFGNSKSNQIKENNKLEKETTFETDNIEEVINEMSNQIRDDKAAEKRVITHEFVDEINIIKNEDENLAIGDSLLVSESSKIMLNEYDATYYESGKTPYYSSDEYRVVEAIVYEMPDGKIVVARNQDEVNYCENINGKNITAYLSSSQYGIEGFYSSQDVVTRKRVR